MKPFLLTETNWKTLRDYSPDLAILPWGATEAHNLHLPYSTDVIETERIAIESALKAREKNAKSLVLPVIPFGVNTGQLDIRGTISINPSTQFALLKDIADDLNRQGIHKLLIINGHGGNDFKQMIRETGAMHPEMFICTCNWYQAVDGKDYFEKGGGHADEMETSLMLFLEPAMVLPLSDAGKGRAKKFRIDAFNGKWAWAERRWSEVTADTGIGDPSLATKEKGEKYFKAVTDKISELIVGISKADISDLYSEV